jgi:RHS repeat-associated protein
MDQLGSVVNSSQAYFPWGETKGTSNPQDTWNFATYWQDSNTGLDYANNRYYSNQYGRFMTPDPYQAQVGGPGDPNDPGSWNRYTYTRGDPVNRYDPAGTDDCGPNWVSDASLSGPCDIPDPYGGYFDLSSIISYWQGFAAPQNAYIPGFSAPAWTTYGYGTILGTVDWTEVVDYLTQTPTATAGAAIGSTWFDFLKVLVGNPVLNALGLLLAGQPMSTLEDDCNRQYQADLAVCRALQSSSCYNQAMQRLAACLSGQPLPPFPYTMPNPKPPLRPFKPRTEETFVPLRTLKPLSAQ